MNSHPRPSVVAPLARLGLLAALLGSAGALPGKEPNASAPVDPGPFPVRVHVFEDYETEIEKRWWLRGTIEEEEVPPSRSASVPNRRAIRAAPSRNFDRKMGDQSVEWKAVVFNPVPGPPMGPRTRLRFRYRIEGTTTLRVQIYSLSRNYHRFLTLENLPQGTWQDVTVDLTTARRPDGSGGPLAEDERIDDIQFYIDPRGELLIDDIVLYEASPATEKRPFPQRIIFTGWFDTGEQGKEWPGEFEIVPHEKPRTWDAARSVPAGAGGSHHLRVNLRGERPVGPGTKLFFRYRLQGGNGPMGAVLIGKTGTARSTSVVPTPVRDRWTEHLLSFEIPGPLSCDEIVFTLPPGATLLVDDILLFE